MRTVIRAAAIALSAWPLASCSASQGVPPLPREFRAAWVATVANIDWPSEPGLSTDRQKAELVAIMDRAVALNLNAIVFQVRPACDALYESRLEPWSEYLTGTMGKAPSPSYDPLRLAVEEAHRRGLELHAWFNPYRAHHPSAKSPVSPDHVSRTKPNIVRTYGKHLWLDPAEAGTQDHSFAVMMDVVKRYDVDGIHMDDYFYPYKEKDASGSVIDFPDDVPWSRYREGGGKLARDDWRRDAVDRFIRRVYEGAHRIKPWVRVGISPFGIWRPGNPPQIRGFDAYAEIYADSLKWLRNGWVDYFTPQLYWAIAPPAQSYPVLLKWWVEQNTQGRHIWPGNYTSRVGATWKPKEIVDQVEVTRSQAGATGNVHFSMKALMGSGNELARMLTAGPYAEPAVPPACPWLAAGRGIDSAEISLTGGKLTVSPARGQEPWLWAVQWRSGGAWRLKVYPGHVRTLPAPTSAGGVIAVRAIDRFGRESAAKTVRQSG